LGLRERKKMETRRVIAETARALFEQRGFDAVTVAEVADAANVSVKTLFTYFQSKEMSRISSRGSGNSFFEVVREPDTHPQTEPDTHPRKVGVCAS
jgi:AcrR family transcriptional regulator